LTLPADATAVSEPGVTDQSKPALTTSIFGLIDLVGQATRGQLTLFIFATICLSSMSGLVSLMQPYVMATVAKVPIAQQGTVNANLNNVMLIGAMLATPIFGGLADKIGRKPLMLGSLFGQTVTLLLYPFASGEIALYALRLWFGIALAAQAMSIGTLIMDYPAEQSRGRFISVMLALQSLSFAALVGLIGGRLPLLLADMGFSEVWGTRLAFWIPASIGAIAFAFAALRYREPHRVVLDTGTAEKPGIWKSLAETLKHARRDARFRMVFFVGLVIRSDFVIVNTFLALWVTNAATRIGISPAVAAAHAGLLVTIIMFCQVGSGFLVGYLADRMDRNRLLAVLLLFAASAYGAAGLVSDILGIQGLALAVALGFAEGASTTIGQTLLGNNAPPALRGSSISVFALVGQLPRNPGPARAGCPAHRTAR
jgi:MFS family permease